MGLPPINLSHLEQPQLDARTGPSWAALSGVQSRGGGVRAHGWQAALRLTLLSPGLRSAQPLQSTLSLVLMAGMHGSSVPGWPRASETCLGVQPSSA